ncbi:hypothetical protein Tco_0011322 [Tanacetum coccineum]
MPGKEAEKEDEAENEPNRKARKEETTEAPSSQHVEYYLKHRINKKLIEKHYGFKPGLLAQSGSLGVDFLNMEMIKDDWELEHKEVSFLGRRLNLLVRPKEVENVRIKETHHLEHIIQQPIF